MRVTVGDSGLCIRGKNSQTGSQLVYKNRKQIQKEFMLLLLLLLKSVIVLVELADICCYLDIVRSV